jgi:hypothetical protein
MSTQSIVEMYQEIKAEYPALNGRLERAVNLVNGGHVKQHSDSVYSVLSLTTGARYMVAFEPITSDGHGWHCGCYDNRNGAPRLDWYGSVGRKVCKHIIAASLAEMLSEPVMTVAETNAAQAAFDAACPDFDNGVA